MRYGRDFGKAALVGSTHLCVHLLQASADEELEDGDDVAFDCGHSAPKPLNLVGEGSSVLHRHIIHALQERFTPVACKDDWLQWIAMRPMTRMSMHGNVNV